MSGTDTQQLTPFVVETMMPVRGIYPPGSSGPRDAKLYLQRWKSENGFD